MTDTMTAIVSTIKSGLKEKGIECHSVCQMPDVNETRVLLAFGSRDNKRLTPRKIKKALNSMGIGHFQVENSFRRLSAAFVHLEVVMGARTESERNEVGG